MIIRFVLFLLLNFTGLALGGLATRAGTTSDWYNQLNKAPWTPPGWVFGVAWIIIMICFALYMAYAYEASQHKTTLLVLFATQWVLNFAWNPVFFKFHAVLFALILIISLSVLVGYFLINGWSQLKLKTLLLLPYFLWLIIATSLNAYIYLKN